MKRSTLRKAGSKAAIRKRLDALCREIVFRRDGYKCVKSGKTVNLQWAHCYSRRYASMRWNPDNSMCLNAGEHLSWHHKPLEAVAWFNKTYPERAARLLLLSQTKQKVDLKAVELWLHQQLKGAAK